MRPDNLDLHAQAYVDGELGQEEEFLFEQCLALDLRLRAEVRDLQRLAIGLRREAQYHGMPSALRAGVLAACRSAQRRSAWRERARRAWAGLRGGLAWQPLAPALSLAVLCSVVAGAALVARSQAEARFGADLVASHVRATRMQQPVQLASAEQATVRPWFARQLGFSPPVRALDVPGIAILGGRVDSVAGQKVAVIVYLRGGHRVDHYIWPSRLADSDAEVTVVDGYRVAQWTRGGMAHRLVSDLGEQELQVIVQACYQEEKG